MVVKSFGGNGVGTLRITGVQGQVITCVGGLNKVSSVWKSNEVGIELVEESWGRKGSILGSGSWRK